MGTIIRKQKAQVDADSMIRYLTGMFFKGEINVKLDEVNQARKEKWKRKYKSPDALKQLLEARKKSRTPRRPKVPDPMVKWRKRCAAEGWTVATPGRYSKPVKPPTRSGQTGIPEGILVYRNV